MCNLMKKYKILLLAELLLLLVLLPGCFKQAEQVYSVNGMTGSAVQESRFQGAYFSVEPGVYQVKAKLEGLKDGYVYVNAGCEQGEFRGFRCNGATIFPGQTDLDFEIYSLENNDLAYVTLDFGNQEPVQMLRLEVFRTNLGARMAVFVLLLVYCVLNGLIIFREGIVAGRIKKEQQLVFWGLSLSVLLAFFPYLTDYLINGTDSMFYWLRIEVLKENLIQRDFFFSDIFLMFPAILRMIGFSLMGAYKMFVFVVMAATAWIAYFSLKKCIGHTYAALFGSVIYVLSPYRINILYNRGAVGVYLAMMFWPLVITGIYRLIRLFGKKEKQYQKQKVSGDSIRIGIISLLIILTVGTAVYQVNDIVIRSNPIWLYHAENLGTGSVVSEE